MSDIEQNSADIGKWLKLARCQGVGAKVFERLLDYFGSVDRALGASVSQLCGVGGIGQMTAEKIAGSRASFDVEAELELALKLGVWMVTLEDDRYPTLLKRIYDPPPILYVKGSLIKGDNLGIAIVGSRRCSLYGQEQSSRFGYLLGSSGFTIVSGMARGIDTSAHHGALKAGARTIGVMGCGLANIFPPENEKLFGLIAGSGGCISELPLGYEPLAENFPSRNRIIAGMTLGTIVIEASSRSGALITAQMAMENEREVMAVPGKIDSPLSRGAHRLIKDGAALVESVDDVMESLGTVTSQLQSHVNKTSQEAADVVEGPLFDVKQLKLTDSEKLVFDCLGGEAVHIEDVISQSDISAGAVNGALVSLRLKGLTKQLPGNLFLRR